MSSKGLILIVGDRSLDRAYYQRVLEWAEFDVVTASDGAEALLLWKTHTFDLVLSDIRMPNLDGYALYLRVSENDEIDNVPFLFLTAYHPDSSVQLYGDMMGAGPHLTKPVKPTDLVKAVSHHTRKACNVLQTMQQS